FYTILSSFYAAAPYPHLHSFPTRRSSDLLGDSQLTLQLQRYVGHSSTIGKRWTIAGTLTMTGSKIDGTLRVSGDIDGGTETIATDRKSTRLNSSHVSISYAVFCLKKKKR